MESQTVMHAPEYAGGSKYSKGFRGRAAADENETDTNVSDSEQSQSYSETQIHEQLDLTQGNDSDTPTPSQNHCESDSSRNKTPSPPPHPIAKASNCIVCIDDDETQSDSDEEPEIMYVTNTIRKTSPDDCKTKTQAAEKQQPARPVSPVQYKYVKNAPGKLYLWHVKGYEVIHVTNAAQKTNPDDYKGENSAKPQTVKPVLPSVDTSGIPQID